MLTRSFTPANVSPAFGRYNQAVEVTQAQKWLLISGQLGLDPDGTLEQGFAAQTARIFKAIDACLDDAGMARANLVKLSTYLINTSDRAEYMAMRDNWVCDPLPASTLLFVPALAVPGALIEIEAIAAA